MWRLAGSSRSPRRTSAPASFSAFALSELGFRVRQRTRYLPLKSNCRATPPPCAPVAPVTTTVLPVIFVGSPLSSKGRLFYPACKDSQGECCESYPLGQQAHAV